MRNSTFSQKINFGSIWENWLSKSTKTSFCKALKFLGKTPSHKIYIVCFLVYQHNYQGKNEIKVDFILVKWQNILSIASLDSRSLSILTHKLVMKGQSTICVYQFLVKIDLPLPSLSSFINF